MSFVVAAPELVQGAAQDLAGIGSSLAEASAVVAGPTTGVVAAGQDGVSLAVASMMGSFGQEFQAVSSQVQAFHAQFVGAMSAGAGAYVSTEAANAGQTLLGGGALGNIGQNITGVVTGGGAGQLAGQVGQIGAQAVSQSVTGYQAGLPAAQARGPSGLRNGISAFGATVPGPYQTLVANTVTNLRTLGSAISTNPAPFAQQVAANQMGHAQTFATGLGSAVQSLPAQLANAPANIRLGLQGLLSVNSGALPQQVANNQMGYGHTISTSLQNAAADLGTGVQVLPASFQTAGQALLAGNVRGAVSSVEAGLKNLFIVGSDATKFGGGGFLTLTVSITPTGTVGDLLPILSIPGQIAQTYTNLMPVGSIPTQMAQHATNFIETATGTGVTATVAAVPDATGTPISGILPGLLHYLPANLAAAIGGPPAPVIPPVPS